jgi:hypothetical protein
MVDFTFGKKAGQIYGRNGCEANQVFWEAWRTIARKALIIKMMCLRLLLMFF